MRSKSWARWKQFAHRAAVFQANALFFLLYFVAIVPMRLLGLGAETGVATGSGGSPSWIRRDAGSSDLASVKRQF